MYVQVINGKTGDPEGLRRQLDKWREDVRPGAIGFVGSTVGVAEDGTFVAVVRFDDEAAAQANSSRSEQDAWWQETVKYFDGEPTFRASTDTGTIFGGGDDSAGFVQVMEGKVTDRAKAESMETPEMLDQLHKARPDLLGSFRVWFADGSFLEAAYFTSEAEARKGEKSSDFEGPGEEFAEVFGEMTFVDLKNPMITSA
ncbi:MAG TPA: hypothetical protein VHI95_16025 [Acidimicrobiales bacterium]|nr:hypothetical protein [Acidimicrobiales bacterium]